ncbi:MAG: DUF3472 domain-containing protein [Verrucomicrobiota bacterium]
MKTNSARLLLSLVWNCLILTGSATAGEAMNWEVPLGGNAYLTEQAKEATDKVEAAGVKQWRDEKSVFSVYFRVDRAAVLNLALRLKVPEGESSIRATTSGAVYEKKITGPAEQQVDLGRVTLKAPGYVKVDLQGLRKKGAVFAEMSDLLVASETPELKLDYVKDNKENRFYWGHRGPSIHLPYELPAGKTIEYFYNEVTVPEGQDPIGSYFMANGFGEGYFGMQVNSEKERRVLFSVWSPFKTDNPKEIPDDHRVKLLAKGSTVHGGEFGGEGSGGQSYLIYPWKAGTTYRFLNRAHPDGAGHTIYTAWFFAPEAAKWQLIASFQRPGTNKYLTGAHSFLENFADRNGYLTRMAYYGNQWARDTKGEWNEVTKSRFTGDDIANRGFRLDYAGGATKGRFFMRNGGFFPENVKLGSSFERQSTRAQRPVIDIDKLEAVN